MSGKVIRCSRCGKRWRGQDGWNTVYIAGLLVGHECPQCQTVEEDLEAQVNLVLNPPAEWATGDLSTDEDRQNYVRQLITRYPTPKIMRHKADLLAAARTDVADIVRVMRRIADHMESGGLYEDGSGP